jgi:hypothetical protein
MTLLHVIVVIVACNCVVVAGIVEVDAVQVVVAGIVACNCVIVAGTVDVDAVQVVAYCVV